MKFAIHFNFPRLYIDLYACGREFYLNFGWFKTDTIVAEWRFGPVFFVEKIASTSPTDKFTLYNFQVGFHAFTREFILALGTCQYDD